MAAEYLSRIIGLEALVEAVGAARQAGKTIVHCHGCFDVVHPGHIRFLEFARRQGDVLVVSLAGDPSEQGGDSYEGQRPYIRGDLRAENVAAIMFVDHVHVASGPSAEAVLSAIQPDVYVKGREYEHITDPAFQAERHIVERYGGRIIFSSGEIVFSATDAEERVPQSAEFEAHRLSRLCHHHGISLSSIEESLERFRDLKVLVVGDVIVDRYVFCDAMGIASESPMISLVERDRSCYVGGAAIVARHAAALGAKTFLVSSVGCDESSKMAADVLQREGVESHLIEARDAVVEKTRFVADDDSKLFKVDRARCQPLDSVAERRAAAILEQKSKVADAVILCDFGYGMITGGLLNRVLPTLRQNVRTLAADVSGGRANLLSFRHVDLLCPTEREARGMLSDFESGLSAVAWDLLQRTQAKQLIVTLDKRGLVAFDRRSHRRDSPDWDARLVSEQLPSFAGQTVDRLGCGDALLAAATLTLAAGGRLVQASYLGNAAAAIELARLGNYPVDAMQVRQWVRARPELSSRRMRAVTVPRKRVEPVTSPPGDAGTVPCRSTSCSDPEACRESSRAKP